MSCDCSCVGSRLAIVGILETVGVLATVGVLVIVWRAFSNCWYLVDRLLTDSLLMDASLLTTD